MKWGYQETVLNWAVWSFGCSVNDHWGRWPSIFVVFFGPVRVVFASNG
jgi:hypothetical protein